MNGFLNSTSDAKHDLSKRNADDSTVEGSRGADRCAEEYKGKQAARHRGRKAGRAYASIRHCRYADESSRHISECACIMFSLRHAM